MSFRAVLLEENDDVSMSITQVDEADLPDGDVTVYVSHSTINYKDGLAITNRSPIVTSYPMVPGIDFAGVVADSSDERFSRGDGVVLTGWGVGESHWGGLAEKARVPADWLVPLPDTFDTAQAMAIGTAGFTAMLCVFALEDHGIAPDSGPVIVTGATGGVGSVAIALLAGLGYEVIASTGRATENAYLEALGASSIVDRSEFSEASKRPLGKARFAGAVDVVGSHTLANVLAQTRENGCVAACGLAQGMDLTTSVAPFILRGVTLAGVNSVTVPHDRRLEAWERLGRDLDVGKLTSMTRHVALDDVGEVATQILDGEIRGRIVVDVTR